MKTTMKKLALITFVALFFFAGNVMATETEKNALIHESIETELEIEDWMINESVWERNQMEAVEFTQEFEATLELEAWMFDDGFWESKLVPEVHEEELVVECWMISENLWNR